MSKLDTLAIRDRVSARTFGWTGTVGAPEPVRKAAADYQAAVTALDDALVDLEVEEAKRRTLLKEHNNAVADALREGKMPPAPKVPSLEALEVKHGAIIAARETFVNEAAAVAERVAAEHYPEWRAEIVAQLQSAAAALVQATEVAAQTAGDWGSAAHTLARLDRSWAPRTAQLDDSSFLAALDRWVQVAGIESSQMASNVARAASRLHEMTEEPVVTEYDPAGGLKQYTSGFLAQQSPFVREAMVREAADSLPPTAA